MVSDDSEKKPDRVTFYYTKLFFSVNTLSGNNVFSLREGGSNIS